MSAKMKETRDDERLSEAVSAQFYGKKTIGSAIKMMSDQSKYSSFSWLRTPEERAGVRLDGKTAALLYNALHVIADKIPPWNKLTLDETHEYLYVLHHFAWDMLSKCFVDNDKSVNKK